MSTDKCPKCGALVKSEEDSESYGVFQCGTFFNGDKVVDQSSDCITSQRDQLAEQVKRLREEVGKAWKEGVDHGSTPRSKSCSSWETSRAKRISEGGE